MTGTMEAKSTNETQDFAERRGSDRHRVLKGANLSFNNGYGAFECVVKNMSDKGARLVFGETSAVPSQFALQLAGERTRRQATVRWRTLNALGVSFD